MAKINIQEWLQFIDQNLVTETRIEEIATKIIKGELLTQKELAMYQSKAERIEAKIKTLR